MPSRIAPTTTKPASTSSSTANQPPAITGFTPGKSHGTTAHVALDGTLPGGQKVTVRFSDDGRPMVHNQGNLFSIRPMTRSEIQAVYDAIKNVKDSKTQQVAVRLGLQLMQFAWQDTVRDQFKPHGGGGPVRLS